MRHNFIETIMGVIVLTVAGVFVYFAYSSSQFAPKDGYMLQAQFSRIDGLNIGDDVRMSGVKIGTVMDQQLDNKTFRAVVKFNVQNNIKLPIDSSAQILTDGLLGDKYVSLLAGGDEKNLPENGEIQYTQSSVRLEDMIGQLMFGSTSSSKDQDKAGGPKPQ